MRDTTGQTSGGGALGEDEDAGADGVVRVLVVDDDEGIRETLRFALEDAGYAVREAADGVTALELLRASRDGLIVLLDLVMPGMDGAALVRALADEPELARRHRFVVVTASARVGLLEAELERLPIPPSAVVRKPFDVDALFAAVRRAADAMAGS